MNRLNLKKSKAREVRLKKYIDQLNNKPKYTVEQQVMLELLYLDKTTAGRKKYKEYLRSINVEE